MKCVCYNWSRNYVCIFIVLGCKWNKSKHSQFYSEVLYSYAWFYSVCNRNPRTLKAENLNIPPSPQMLAPKPDTQIHMDKWLLLHWYCMSAVPTEFSGNTVAYFQTLGVDLLHSQEHTWTTKFQSSFNSAWTNSLDSRLNKYEYIHTHTHLYMHIYIHIHTYI